MRFGLFSLIFASLSLAAGQGEGWLSLFDGKSLDGWSVASKPGDNGKGFWYVRDGAITADSRGHGDHDYIWLISDGEYSDFELKLEVRAHRDSKGNGGVQVRSRYDYQEGWLDGPQMDIHPPAPFRVGLIYDETRETKRWIHPSMPDWNIKSSDAPHEFTWKYADEGDGWNTIHITCKGTRIATVLNGDLITDQDFAGILDDEAHRSHNVGLNGHIALQLHKGAELHVQYRNIRLKKLP